MVWLSENEVTEEQKKEIVESFNLKEFSAEELLTGVRDSGLFSAKKIDERVLDIVKNKDQLLNEKDVKIKEQDLKINKLDTSLQNAKKYIDPCYLHYL